MAVSKSEPGSENNSETASWKDFPEIRKTFRIQSRQGLHARPAAVFAQVATRFKCTIRVCKGKLAVDARSIMGLLTLSASRGSMLDVSAQGPDAEEALRVLEQIICRADLPAIVTVAKPDGSTPPPK